MLIRLLALCWLALAGIAQAAEPLDPELAYRFSARALDENTIEARWDIAPDYYLYRHKIAFTAAGAKLGAPDLPKGKEKDDEFFGKVETYRDQLVVRIPVLEGSGSIVLKAESQGCWDQGICYPPLTQEAKITLAATSSTPAQSSLAATGAVPPAPTFESTPATASAGDESGQHRQAAARAAASGSPSPASSALACCSRSRPACSR